MTDQEKGLAVVAGIVVLALIGTVIKGMQPVSLVERSTAPKASPSPIVKEEKDKKCVTAAGNIWKLSLLYSDSACTKPFGIVEDVDRPGVVVVSVFDEVEQTAKTQVFDRNKITRSTYVKD